ncbi:hypothetical protein INP82_19750 (plasmid) [Citrobacter sedlakii]|uniref:hypothetical protein n=1 Tax=Citrobacter TaxID=544 RepID=UPI001969D5D4|nr:MULTISPECIES: hypothetical protein [Citrobacter]MBM9569641.1 hypothetical protein [Citrobacter sedlakii]HBL4693494.1 hypothetical protein [Citrobacter sedlakii]HBL4707931.1 hypothetical protein [Citrobacter sedlakii]HBL4722028.1 hypothetical protein [Citrobacter sedlakii]HCA7842979.1 hypothetical protein [Citrobacter sedlakii]
MSQHWYEVKSNQGIVQVMLGWDPPLQWCKRKLTAVCSHQTRIGNLDAHLI